MRAHACCLLALVLGYNDANGAGEGLVQKPFFSPPKSNLSSGGGSSGGGGGSYSMESLGLGRSVFSDINLDDLTTMYIRIMLSPVVAALESLRFLFRSYPCLA